MVSIPLGQMGNPYFFCVSPTILGKSIYEISFIKLHLFLKVVGFSPFFLTSIYNSKLKYKKISLNHLPFTLHIFVNAMPVDMVKKMNRIKNKSQRFVKDDFDISESAVASSYDLEYSLPGHWLIAFKSTDLNTIAHEVFHIVMWHNKYIGQKFNNGSEESYAYLFGYLIQEINEFVKTSK